MQAQTEIIPGSCFLLNICLNFRGRNEIKSPGHVEAELVAKYLTNFIDFQDLDQVNLEQNSGRDPKVKEIIQTHPDLDGHFLKGSLLIHSKGGIVRGVVVR